jgi:hypothetical protein
MNHEQRLAGNAEPLVALDGESYAGPVRPAPVWTEQVEAAWVTFTRR